MYSVIRFKKTGEIYHYYWTPVKEYPNLIKISYHGTYRDEIDPDERDDPEKESSKRAKDQLEDHKRIIDLHFEGIDSSNPVIVEPCMYTNTPDNDFILDVHPTMKNVVIGAGFSGHGFKMSPETGEILADLALEKEPAYDMSFFSLDRFNK
ncbi:Oidioi.mRNA.OKI2018_I69.chr1.g1040.t1.cds [Oikopleura dioica]|uniref:Oidioi.mRNA.OKI2018_I69.chr1.g1040.t1.cds n=1 Tax=Oikopleura dioica TaxID=34765 RepID=A0ABN7SRX1_OIKDI|nr:Oidioi.mRNA.OKI2018_I69.chr1.g1040.t1.cds [Oikopleura dioica]